jgi:hypothetical protein
MIMAVLLRGQWQRYPFVFLYLVGDFLTTIREMQPSLGIVGATREARNSFARMYWLDERIMQGLLFLLVISLIYRATAHLKPRRTLLLGIVSGTLLFGVVTFLFYFDATVATGKWMTPWTRNMNFCAALLDLGLWALLIGARTKDYKLLMISGALGIQFTGGAIGQSLRQLSHSLTLFTACLITLTYLTCLYIWWQAFRDRPETLQPVSHLPK